MIGKRNFLAGAAIALALALPAASLAASPDEDAQLFAALRQNVIGVLGSGDRIYLQLLNGKGTETLALGKPYRDGWVLGALDPTSARFDQPGKASITIMLSPLGAPSPAAQDSGPSHVEVLPSTALLALAQQAIDRGEWDGKPTLSLTLAQSQRLAAYELMLEDFVAQNGDAARAMLTGDGPDRIFGPAVVADYHDLRDQTSVAVMRINEASRLAVNPRDPDPIKSTQDSIMIAQAQLQAADGHPAIQGYLPGYIERLQGFLAQLQAGK